MKRQTPESVVVRQVLDGLRLRRVSAFRLSSGAFALEGRDGTRRYFRASWVGAPDIVVLLRGGAGFIECKAAKGKLSPPQEAFRDLCAEVGVPWVLARSWEDVDVWLSKGAE